MVEVAYASPRKAGLALSGGNNYINMNLNQLDSQYWLLGDAQADLVAQTPRR